MTDNEIIKALECCSTYKGKCTDCPAFVKVDRSNCKQVLLGAIEIINRQKGDIERLEETIALQSETLGTQNKMWKTARNDGIKLFAEVLKEKTAYFYSAFGVRHEIDNLVKEMVSEDAVEEETAAKAWERANVGEGNAE